MTAVARLTTRELGRLDLSSPPTLSHAGRGHVLGRRADGGFDPSSGPGTSAGHDRRPRPANPGGGGGPGPHRNGAWPLPPSALALRELRRGRGRGHVCGTHHLVPSHHRLCGRRPAPGADRRGHRGRIYLTRGDGRHPLRRPRGPRPDSTAKRGWHGAAARVRCRSGRGPDSRVLASRSGGPLCSGWPTR